MKDDRDGVPRTAEGRLIEWAKSLFRDPWNYWPRVSVLGRMMDEGPGASQSTAVTSDGGLGRMVDQFASSMEKHIRCSDVYEAYCAMPPRLSLIVDCTYLHCPSRYDVPRSWEAAVGESGLGEQEYAKRKREMLGWLDSYLSIDKRQRRAANA